MNIHRKPTFVHPRRGLGLSIRQLGWLVLGAVAIALIPAFVGDYWVRVLIFVFINIGLASAWNIIGGFTGYASFGHGVFFGIGAFVSAIGIVRYGLPLPIMMLLGGLASALIALCFVPIFKQRGLYFAMSTLAVMLVFETVFQRWTVTRGLKPHDVGWTVKSSLSLIEFYYIFLFLLAAVIGTVILLVNSRAGYAMKAIHKDEVLAASLGVRTNYYKAVAFVFSAVWPGVLGAAFAPFLSFVSVQSVFDLNITLNMILMCIFGGAGTILGPIVGGIALSVIDQIAWGNFLHYHRLINGALIVAIITLYPAGLVAMARGFKERRRSRVDISNINPKRRVS
ncbi:branched-chain amino acid ABC transporter permease [Alcaligenaceae bacterium]|nr:branched-chain amino acid ABC transporter permease [Alcaligenaceae bacterium]